jgi:hypothetical protein
MTRATVSADGETITVHVPMTFRKRGGRKREVTPDGSEWAPRPQVDNGQGPGARLPLAEDAG